MVQKDTVSSLLNAAEELFSERGFAETSLRNITSRAGVNLAAVNYHFGSKKALIQAVFSRLLDPFCEQLEVEMAKLTHESPERILSTPKLLRLIFSLTLKTSQDSPRKLGIFMRLLGLAYTQGQGHLRRYLTKEYAHVLAPLLELLKKSTPQLTDQERFWRIHFMLGTIVFTLSGVDALKAMAEYDLGEESSIALVIARLTPFLAAGLDAPSESLAFD